MTPQIHIDRADGVESPDDDSFSRWVSVALVADGDRLPGTAPELSLRITDDHEMAALNQQFRGKSGATNVLSFPADLPEVVASELLGDIVICAPLVAEEAREQGKAIDAHWAHLTVHGVLHLLGHDHLNDEDAVLMEALEIGALQSLGYPNPYESNATISQGGVAAS